MKKNILQVAVMSPQLRKPVQLYGQPWNGQQPGEVASHTFGASLFFMGSTHESFETFCCQLCQVMLFSGSYLVRGCLAEADTREDVLLK